MALALDPTLATQPLRDLVDRLTKGDPLDGPPDHFVGPIEDAVAAARAAAPGGDLDPLRERAAREPLDVDISAFSDEFCEGFLRGQAHVFDWLDQQADEHRWPTGEARTAAPESLGRGRTSGL